MAGVTIKAGEGNALNVLGMPLRFLCDAQDTEGAWSLMEEEIPVGLGPPPHRHDFEELFNILEGQVEFTFRGQRLLAVRDASYG